MINTTFLLWNLQGMGSPKEDVLKIIETIKPIVIACQETPYVDDFVNKN